MIEVHRSASLIDIPIEEFEGLVAGKRCHPFYRRLNQRRYRFMSKREAYPPEIALVLGCKPLFHAQFLIIQPTPFPKPAKTAFEVIDESPGGISLLTPRVETRAKIDIMVYDRRGGTRIVCEIRFLCGMSERREHGRSRLHTCVFQKWVATKFAW